MVRLTSVLFASLLFLTACRAPTVRPEAAAAPVVAPPPASALVAAPDFDCASPPTADCCRAMTPRCLACRREAAATRAAWEHACPSGTGTRSAEGCAADADACQLPTP